MTHIPLFAALALAVSAGTAFASGPGGKQPIRTGICHETANNPLNANSVFASMCARKLETIAFHTAPAHAEKARTETISTSGEPNDISRIATVMQEIRQAKQEGNTVTPQPLPELAQGDAPVIETAPRDTGETDQYAVQVPVIEYVPANSPRPVVMDTPRYDAPDTTRLSGALRDLRMAKLERQASPDKLWFVGVYR